MKSLLTPPINYEQLETWKLQAIECDHVYRMNVVAVGPSLNYTYTCEKCGCKTEETPQNLKYSIK